jgi:hypothetical protein
MNFASSYTAISSAANALHGTSVAARQWSSSWPNYNWLTGLLGWLNFASRSSSHMSLSRVLVMT